MYEPFEPAAFQYGQYSVSCQAQSTSVCDCTLCLFPHDYLHNHLLFLSHCSVIVNQAALIPFGKL